MPHSDCAHRLEAHIAALTSGGPRHQHNPAGITAACDYITSTLDLQGYQVAEQRYGEQPHQINFTAELPGASAAGYLELGAHWDSVASSLGADDNASGVAALLEIARELAGRRLAHPVRLCFFAEEEEGGFPGNTAHLQATSDRGEGIQAGLVLEMIGYRDSSPGSQRLPEAAAAALSARGIRPPETGDFIAVVGDISAGAWVEALTGASSRLSKDLPVLPLVAPAGAISDAGRSDHAAYWAAGLPGIMITDIADFRNPHYHRATDTLQTLDLEFAAQVTGLVTAALSSRQV